MKDNFAELIKAATDMPTPTPDFERRVMVEVARRAIERSRRRARFNLVASLSGVTITAAASVAAVMLWYPTQIVIAIDPGAIFDSVVAGIKALIP
jgi:hypothetical protein